ncbi:MAG: hypothetical protein IJ418_23530 [Clostridia bacterium]|nr:hypothetical protein [Clostridia bacterium]
MQAFFSRLRAALTPQALALFAVLVLMLLLASRDDDAQSLESRIARTLSMADGAGHVEVTIRMQEIQASGSLLDAHQTEKTPIGAVAVAQGADDPLVAVRLQEALCALLGLPAASVSVITGGK